MFDLRLIIASIAIVCFGGHGISRERYPGQYAQLDPAISKWFNEQHVPDHPSNSCCSNADGTRAEQDIRDGHYWTRFVYKSGGIEMGSGWMQVPDDVIIRDGKPNPVGAPIVWWYIADDDDGDGGAALTIRCYKAAADA